MEIEIKKIDERLIKLSQDVELIKNILISKGELTSWAKEELVKARNEKEDDYTDLDDL